jgi:Domain of unknown function (DUF4381)
VNTNDIHDIKPDVIIPLPWWVWVAIAGMVLILIVAAWLYWQYRRERAKEVFVPRKSAVEEARERLELARQLMVAGKLEAFYVAVSDAVRQYIERQFRIRATEQTIEEFLQDMARSPRLQDSHKELLEQFMVQCDLVKFARYQPGPAEMEAALSAATRFVDETVPQKPVEAR